MRAFVGVPVPAHAGLVAVAEELRASGADLKVVDTDQFHLTLKFLGDVPEETARLLLKTLRESELPRPFEIAVADVGAFPSPRKLNVIWAGIQDPTGGLAKIHVALERTWVTLGQPSEGREFHAHLTLARKRTDRGMDAARGVLERHRGVPFGGASVNAVNLYRSTLTSKGPLYEVVEAVTL